MSSNAPFRTRPESELVWYYAQCLEVLKYHPAIRPQVLELLVDKCLEMDVEIKITDVGEAKIDEEKEDDDDDIFELELDEPGPSKEDDEGNLTATVDEMANKLDSLMLLLFQYSSQLSASGTAEAVEELYKVYSHVFESTVLICHKSKFVQFLLLYVCGQEGKLNDAGSIDDDDDDQQDEDSTPLYRQFAAKLIDIVLDPFRATVTRQSGACYLASFVSRASFVCAETVCESVSALLRWAEAYIDSIASQPKSPSRPTADNPGDQCSLHALFYTVCQSAFYIMCFRGTEALEFFHNERMSGNDDEHIDIGAGRWTQLCSHRTRPLRYCLESVRSEFLELSRTHDLIDASVINTVVQRDGSIPVVKHRKRKVSKITTAATLEKERLRGGVGGLGKGTNPLDSFFPFDPYLLRRSHVFIEPVYIHWCGVAGGAGGGAADDFESDDDEVNAAADDTMADDENDDLGGESADDSSSDHDDDEASDSDDSSDGDSDDLAAFEPMSLASDAPPPDTPPRTGVAPREAWSETLKRTRAPSIENGSW